MITQQQLTQRPAGSPAGFQRWRDLLFLHWQVPAEPLQEMLPAPLKIECHQGTAWLGLVPFAMCDVRPWWSLSVPGISHFLETNVRTYVVHPEAGPGVWFFSLDASSRLAASIGRRFWNLPYYFARLSLERHDVVAERRPTTRSVHYRSVGRANGQAAYDLQVRLPATSSGCRTATPPPADQTASLEYWLLERYLLYCWNPRRGALMSGRVHHAPYRWCPVEVETCRQNLLSAGGGPGQRIERPPDHALYAPGVDVTVFPLRPLP